MSYTQQFIQGIQYRSQFDTNFRPDQQSIDILEHTFIETSEKSMDEPFFSIRQHVCSLAQTYAAERSVKSFSYQCLADSHTFLEACIEQKVLNKNYMTLTVGDISVDGERLFGATRETIKEAVMHGVSTIDKPRFHVWLTLVDMTVIDLTIVQQLIDLQRLDEPADDAHWLNVWRPERTGVYDYHPVLTDDDFLMRLQRKAH